MSRCTPTAMPSGLSSADRIGHGKCPARTGRCVKYRAAILVGTLAVCRIAKCRRGGRASMRAVLACCLLVMAQLLVAGPACLQIPPSDGNTCRSTPIPPADPAAQPPPALRTAPRAHGACCAPPGPSRTSAPIEEFVERIGESDCRTVHDCLTERQVQSALSRLQPRRHALLCRLRRPSLHAARLLRLEERTALRLLDLGLARGLTPRTSATTTSATAFPAAATSPAPTIDARRAIPQMMVAVTSAHYRYAPNYSGKLLPDHYPVKISRESIKPGTILYDPHGHLAVVYKVTPEGRIHFIDAHPDNSLTRGVYGKAYKRDSPAVGAGFKRWRPQTLVGATQRADGSYQGGRIVLAADKDLGDWSDEQFFGTEPKRPKNWEQGRFVHEGETLEYYEFVRKRLAKGQLQVRPGRGDALHGPRPVRGSQVPGRRGGCRHQGAHAPATAARPAAGQHLRHQRRLGGATPRRRAMRACGRPSRSCATRLPGSWNWQRSRSDRLAYTGSDLRRDLREVYTREANACTILLYAQQRYAASSCRLPTSRDGCRCSRSIRTTASNAGGARNSKEELLNLPRWRPTRPSGMRPSSACATRSSAPTMCA